MSHYDSCGQPLRMSSGERFFQKGQEEEDSPRLVLVQFGGPGSRKSLKGKKGKGKNPGKKK